MAFSKADLAAALSELLGPAIKEALVPAIKEALVPVFARLDKIDARLDIIDARLESIETRLGTVDARLARLEASRANEDVRRSNSARPVGAPLTALPFAHDGSAWPADVAQPGRMLDLAVSGSEQLPGGGKPNWNRNQSRRFLATAMAPQGDESDGEDEGSIQSRTSRLRVVQLMGGSFERVTGAVFALH